MRSSNVAISPKLITSNLFVFDCGTHYTGYYADNGSTIYFTGTAGSGDPYLMFGGFESYFYGKTVTIESDNSSIGFTSQNFTIGVHNACGSGFYNLDGTQLCGRHQDYYGIYVTQNMVGGTYNLTFKYNGQVVYKVKIVKTF